MCSLRPMRADVNACHSTAIHTGSDARAMTGSGVDSLRKKRILGEAVKARRRRRSERSGKYEEAVDWKRGTTMDTKKDNTTQALTIIVSVVRNFPRQS